MAEAPTKTGRYEVVRELGRGSMGIVYEGYDPVIGRTIAIKTMLTEGLSSQEFQEYKSRFQREAQAAGVLSHPNIVNVFDYGEDSGVLYLIMEYLEGKSLEKLVEGHNILPIETIIPMYDQVCSALDHAHQHGIVHRDVKPANIMILDNGLVKVTDFGIAKMVAMGMTQAGQVLGTPNYMSPEQVKGRQIDGRSDIFSLGIILYDLVTGEMPFSGQNITTVIYKIINENPIPPRELDASIHPGLSYVICKALAKSPNERYQTCRELADDLKNFKYLGGPATPSATVMLNVPPLQGTAWERAAGPPAEMAAPSAAAAEAAAGAAQQVSPAQVPIEVPTLARAGQTPRISPHIWIFMALVGVVILGIFGGAGYWYLHKVNPPAVSPPVGQLSVESNVPGARITVDGKSGPYWVTPYTIPDLSPGPHQLVVSKEGYETFQQAINIEAGKANSVTASLVEQAPQAPAKPPTGQAAAGKGKPEKTAAALTAPARNPRAGGAAAGKPGQLLVTSNVAGAKISVDGNSKPDWSTPLSSPIELGAGTHQVTVSKEGYDDYSRSVTVEAGVTRSIEARLSAPTGAVEVPRMPPGVEVYIDRESVGSGPTTKHLPVGEHTYMVKGPGGASPETTFKVESGRTSVLNLRTTQAGEVAVTGTVEVHTAPLHATVTADGTVMGQTPISFSLSPGRHELVISLPGYQQVEQVVEVIANQTVRKNFQLVHQ